MADEQNMECPFGEMLLTAARESFLRNPHWRRIYDMAPEGAKRRLEVSFFFTEHRGILNTDRDGRFEKYRAWREEVERRMTDEDIEYMIGLKGNTAAVKHFANLLRGRRERLAPKLMSYDDFFAMLDAEGAFDSCDYDEETKKGILGDFLPVLKGSGDPLETHLEDILATAKLKEVRTYPKNEFMYVRVEVRFLTETAEWSRPYQMLAAWDCFNILKGYVFPVGKGTRTRLPIELENPENAAQRTKRMQLAAARATAMKGKE